VSDTVINEAGLAPPLRLRDQCGDPVGGDWRWLGTADSCDERLLDRAVGPVLDVGCGPGRHLLALARRGVEATGIDVTPAAVRVARSRGARVVDGSISGRCRRREHGPLRCSSTATSAFAATRWRCSPGWLRPEVPSVLGAVRQRNKRQRPLGSGVVGTRRRVAAVRAQDRGHRMVLSGWGTAVLLVDHAVVPADRTTPAHMLGVGAGLLAAALAAPRLERADWLTSAAVTAFTAPLSLYLAYDMASVGRWPVWTAVLLGWAGWEAFWAWNGRHTVSTTGATSGPPAP